MAQCNTDMLQRVNVTIGLLSQRFLHLERVLERMTASDMVISIGETLFKTD